MSGGADKLTWDKRKFHVHIPNLFYIIMTFQWDTYTYMCVVIVNSNNKNVTDSCPAPYPDLQEGCARHTQVLQTAVGVAWLLCSSGNC